MNSVPEHILEELDETTVTEPDRRRGMKLIPGNSTKTRSRLRIDVDDSLLDGDGASPKRMRQDRTSSGLPLSEKEQTTTPVVLFAALAGLAIGFFVGRRRDG